MRTTPEASMRGRWTQQFEGPQLHQYETSSHAGSSSVLA